MFCEVMDWYSGGIVNNLPSRELQWIYPHLQDKYSLHIYVLWQTFSSQCYCITAIEDAGCGNLINILKQSLEIVRCPMAWLGRWARANMALLLTDNNTDLVRDKDIRNQETGAAKYKKIVESETESRSRYFPPNNGFPFLCVIGGISVWSRSS